MKALPEILAEIIGTFERLDIPYVVGGSFASSVWGHPRQTRDIDVNLWLEHGHVERLVTSFQADYLISDAEIERTLHESEEYRSFQILHIETLFKVDAFVPHHSRFAESVLAGARRVQIVPGLEANCMSPEDVIIHKLRWFELGNRVSDRQWNDIVQVLDIQREQLKIDYLLKWSDHFGLKDLFLEAMRETEEAT